MNNQQHTPEPWRIECNEFNEENISATMWPSIYSGDFDICGTEGFYCGDRDLDIANARRIVACVNACAGIPTEQLEAYPGAVMRVMKECDELLSELKQVEALSEDRLSQRDDLLAALEKMNRAYVGLMENGRDRIIMLGGDCDPVDVMERNDPHLRESRAAIASARGAA